MFQPKESGAEGAIASVDLTGIFQRKVSEGALIKRINRRIGGYDRKTCTVWGERLRKPRSFFAPWGTPVSYYTIDRYSNGVTGTCSDLEAYGREVGALADSEVLDDGGDR